jgi:membrane protease YdiL (CAAX protease family)
MKSQLITVLLIAGLNIPVFYELYKHALKDKAAWFKAVIAVTFCGLAIYTQTMAAFGGILYLFLTYYRKLRETELDEEVDIWHIKGKDVLITAGLTLLARVAILLIHFVYLIILVQLVKYNIKLQEIISYYTEAGLLLKLILALEIVVVAPVVEEFVFRYFLYGKVFSPRMPLAVAALFSAILFTIAHFNVAGIPTFLGLGLFCAYIYQKKGYWAAVIAHGTSNLFSLLFLNS